MLDVLLKWRERRFRLNQEALTLLEGVVLSKAARHRLQTWRSEIDQVEVTFQQRLDTWLPRW